MSNSEGRKKPKNLKVALSPHSSRPKRHPKNKRVEIRKPRAKLQRSSAETLTPSLMIRRGSWK